MKSFEPFSQAQATAIRALSLATFLIPLLTGCVTSTSRELSVSARDERAARTTVDEARRDIDAGGRLEVLPRLDTVIAEYAGTEGAQDAHFYVGKIHYFVGDYPKAINAFREYLRLAPRGEHAGESAEYGTRLALDLRIRNLHAKLEKEPQSLAYQWELADHLWRRGSYGEAGELYKTIVADNAEYAQDATFKSRLDKQPDGQYVILTPAEVVRRQAEAQPLVIINEATFQTGKNRVEFYGGTWPGGGGTGYRIRQDQQYYAVTGQVLNRGDAPLNGVQVIITIFGFGNVVFDTTTTGIGRLNPGEIRAFSVRFGNIDQLETVYRHECVGTFQR